MKNSILISTLFAAAIFFNGCSAKKQAAPPVPPVLVAQAEVTNVPVQIDPPPVGHVTPILTVTIHSQIGGIIQEVHFKEGSEVKSNDLLFTIDPRPVQAVLARDQAQLKNAEIQFDREQKLFDQKLVSQDEFDTNKTARDTLAATVRSDELNLEFTEIRAPFDGITGSLQFHEGNVVKAPDDTLVTINQIHPIYVAFAVPEEYLPEIKRQMGAGTLKVSATFENMTGPAPQGKLTFVDNSVDETTGTILLKATFPNEDDALWPGQFVNVSLTLSELMNAVVVPSQAVQTGQNGEFIYVVKSNPTNATDQIVDERAVTTGITYQNETVVEKGLQAGETVVTDGQLRLEPGVAVDIKEKSGDGYHFGYQRAMSVPALFIRRPVMTTLVMFGILLFGLVGLHELPVSDLPSVDYPTISVSASLPGASPEVMASAVATPLEKQFSTIAGVDSMTSVSAQGSAQVTIQFSLDRNIDAAAADVQASIAKATRQLPPNMPAPPTYSKVNPADSPVLYIAMSSPTLPLSAVDDYAENLLAEQISQINGVAQVSVFGSQQYAVRVQVDPNKLAAFGLGIDQVEQAIEAGNVNQPLGTLYGKHQAFTVQSNGQLADAADFRPMIIAYRNGNPVRLQDLGNVLDSVQNDKAAAWFNNTRSVILAVQRQPGANTVEVVDSIKKLLPQFRASIPAAVHLDVLFDRSQSIRQSVKDVTHTLLLTVALVVMVIFIFLRNLSATLIPSLALPMSIIGTFGAMALLGYSIDNLSLMSLTLCVGFVVDDAIVMLENIVRHMEMGEPPMQAALNGSKEIGFTIISMTLSLSAVFIPVLFMSGLLGRLLHEFAVTIVVAVLVSGFVSLTLTPMMCSRFVHAQHGQKHGRLYNFFERFFDGVLSRYDRTLQIVMRHRFTTLMVSLLILVVTLFLFKVIPKGFFPDEDTGQIFAITEAAQDISYDAMKAHQEQAAKIVGADPNVAGFGSFIGAGGSSSTLNQGRMFMRLKDFPERKLSADQIIQELRKKLLQLPGITVFMQNPPLIRVGGKLTKALYQYSLQDTDTKELYHWTPILVKKLSEQREFQDVTTDLQIAAPQVNVEIDRDKAAALGVTPEQIENALYDAYGERQSSTIYGDVAEYWVVFEVEPQYQLDPAALARLYIASSNTGTNGAAKLVPLSAVAKLTRSLGPTSISHVGQLPAVTLSFNLAPGVSLGTAVEKLQQIESDLHLPATITGSFQGSAQVFQSSTQGLLVLLIVSIIIIYIILGILYESFIHPITILSGLPSAGFGALITLMLFGLDLNIYGFVGLIMLVGLVKKNAIMMIDFAIEAQRGGKSAAEAIHQGCLLRFRPIMMTTMCALMATLPIALGLGAGGESRRALGLAVVGGLIVSQSLTLYITPVVYLYLESFQEFMTRKRNAKNLPVKSGVNPAAA